MRLKNLNIHIKHCYSFGVYDNLITVNQVTDMCSGIDDRNKAYVTVYHYLFKRLYNFKQQAH
jgi:hypothetical protein